MGGCGSKQNSSDGGRPERYSGNTTSAIRELDATAGVPVFQHGRSGPFNDVVSGAGGTFFVCGEDKLITAHRFSDGQKIQTYSGHTSGINKMAFCESTNMLASASRDLSIRLWKGESPQCTGVLNGHDLSISAISVTQDGSRLASGGRDATVRVWDVGAMKQLARVHRSQALVTCLKWMPNAGGIQSTMVTGAEDLRVRIWDVRTGLREIHTLEGYVYFPVSDRSHLCVYHYTTVTCGNVQLSLDVSPDGRYLLTSSKGFNGVGCEARVWDLRFSRAAVADSTADGGAVQQPILVHTYLGHTQDTGACAFLQQAVGGIPLFLTASKDESIRLWRQDDEQPSQIAQRVEVGSGAFTSLAVMPLRMDEPSLSSSGLDGPAFVVCSFNAGLYCYRVSPARQIVPLLRAEPSEPTY